jgi:hypothetical protein
METTEAGERAMVAERRWSAAKQAGDEPGRIGPLREYRAARRELRRLRAEEETPDPEFAARLRAELLDRY